MAAIVIYDSWFGNCGKVAESIRRGYEISGREIHAAKAKDALKMDLSCYATIIIGSPTHGGKPTGKIKKLMKRLARREGKPRTMFTFTTKADPKGDRDALNWMRGHAQERGFVMMSEERFFVEKVRGPISQAELEKAERYGQEIASKA